MSALCPGCCGIGRYHNLGCPADPPAPNKIYILQPEVVNNSPRNLEKPVPPNPALRSFDTGATRSADAGRYDPEAFFAPIVIERHCEYMQKHRLQADGTVRDGDNWQKGIPLSVYMKGMWRHFLHLWTRHRGYVVQDDKASADMEEDLCALRFNIDGMLFELLKNKRAAAPKDPA